MFKKWIGKRVVLYTVEPNCVNYVGTLEAARGNVISLVDITPMRETRKMPDMVVNFVRKQYDKLTLVMDSADDPSQQQGES